MLVQQGVSSPPTLICSDHPLYFLPQEHSQPPDALPSATSERTKRQKRSALIVDDVSDVTEMLAVLLTHAGYDVVTAESAPRALTSARTRQFDIVISDIGMPEMNGYQLVQILRGIPGYETIPMIAVTGYSMFNDRQKSLASGFTAHMTKPIDPGALLDLIDQL